jgi:glycosyltransferase involved in cell wall biosynthesis
LEYLIQALAIAKNRLKNFRLIIAGSLKKNDSYWNHIQQLIDSENLNDNVIEIIQYIPDEDIEIYFKASDVLILPYLYIFQTGVLFLSFQFGLPAICSDVGCIKEDINKGQNGLLCNPRDSKDLAKKIEAFFDSDLYTELDLRRDLIKEAALAEHSWDSIGLTLLEVYKDILGNR